MPTILPFPAKYPSVYLKNENEPQFNMAGMHHSNLDFGLSVDAVSAVSFTPAFTNNDL
jgi:hypothetical protein